MGSYSSRPSNGVQGAAYLLILPFLYYLGDLKKSPIDRTIYGLGIPIVTFGALSLPIIDYYGGFLSWLKGTF